MNIYWKIGSYFIFTAAIIFGIHWYGSARYDEGYQKREAIAVKSALEATQQAREKEQHWQLTLNEARNDAVKREIKLSADAAAARNVSGRLQRDLADLRNKLPELTEQAVRQYADAASVVFGECQREYQSLAAITDRIDSDRQTLEKGWPK